MLLTLVPIAVPSLSMIARADSVASEVFWTYRDAESLSWTRSKLQQNFACPKIRNEDCSRVSASRDQSGMVVEQFTTEIAMELPLYVDL